MQTSHNAWNVQTGVRTVLAALILITGLARVGSAQQTASIVGNVADESGAAMPGVTVTATSPALQVASMTAVTDERGEYRLTTLPIGTYTVEYALSGFSSFVIHAGGPPFNVYAVQRGLSRDDFVGTSAVFFAVVNLLKLPPYFALGQFTWEGFLASATLFPVALAANALGVFIVRRMSTALFYKLVYAATFIIGLKLVWDGLMT